MSFALAEISEPDTSGQTPPPRTKPAKRAAPKKRATAKR